MTVTEKRSRPVRTGQRTAPPTRHRHIRHHRRPRVPTSRANTALAATLAALFFFGPTVARACGVEPTQIENRPLRALPSPTEGWRFLPDLDGWAVDHLPLRDAAVRTNGWISQHVFRELSTSGTGGSAAVLAGRDGWLFYRDDMRMRCAPAQPLERTLAQLERLRGLVTALGHQFVVVVPPDKSTIEAGMLPASYPSRSCSEAADRAFWHRMEAAPPGYLDMYGPVENVARTRGHAYYPTDTHWTPAATAAYARTLMSRIDPGLLTSTAFVTSGTQLKTTDLTRMIGMPRTERAPAVRVRRDGVSVHRSGQPIEGDPAAHSTATTTGAPLFTAPTLILGDSFTEQSMAALAPFFADLTYAHWNLADTDPAAVARLIRACPVVVVEVVQREFQGGAAPLLVGSVLDRVAARLRAPAPHP